MTVRARSRRYRRHRRRQGTSSVMSDAGFVSSCLGRYDNVTWYLRSSMSSRLRLILRLHRWRPAEMMIRQPLKPLKPLKPLNPANYLFCIGPPVIQSTLRLQGPEVLLRRSNRRPGTLRRLIQGNVCQQPERSQPIYFIRIITAVREKLATGSGTLPMLL